MTVSRLRSHFSRPPKPAGTVVEAALGIIAPKAAHTVAGSMSRLVRGIMLHRMATAWSDGATLEDQMRDVIRPLDGCTPTCRRWSSGSCGASWSA